MDDKWAWGFITNHDTGEDIGMFTCKTAEMNLHELHNQNCMCNPKVGILPADDRLGYMVQHQVIGN